LPTTHSLIQTNISALDEGAGLLAILEPEHYTAGCEPAFRSTIGAHFRHVLEHYRCFFTQLEDAVLCYDDRKRDQLLECDVAYAARTIDEVKNQFANFDQQQIHQFYQIADQQADGLVATSLHRELLFLQSHTVHHYAIIGAMARSFGKQPEDDFGVAIETRTYQAETTCDSSPTETLPCAQ
jgi:uncharacterized damage-inducible protein DinB